MSDAALARALGLRRYDLIHKRQPRYWIYPSEARRILSRVKMIREGRLKLVATRRDKARVYYEPVIVTDNPVPPVPEVVATPVLDFRGVRLVMMPKEPRFERSAAFSLKPTRVLPQRRRGV